MTLEPEPSFSTYQPVLNMIFIIFLALLLILIAALAYPKYSLKKTHNSENRAEAERKEEAGKTERMGCSERNDEEDDGDGGD